jgi:hypothetical protein
MDMVALWAGNDPGGAVADADQRVLVVTVPERSKGGMMISTNRNDGGNNVLRQELWVSSRCRQGATGSKDLPHMKKGHPRHKISGTHMQAAPPEHLESTRGLVLTPSSPWVSKPMIAALKPVICEPYKDGIRSEGHLGLGGQACNFPHLIMNR